MTTRRKLPSRRRCTTFEFKHGNVDYVCSLGFFENGDVAEIFLNSKKIDSDLDINSRDAAVAASIALQYGATPRTLHHSMARNPTGSMQGPLGHVLGMIIGGKI